MGIFGISQEKKDELWIKKTISSCTTLRHISSCRNLILLFNAKHKKELKDKDYYNYVLNDILKLKREEIYIKMWV